MSGCQNAHTQVLTSCKDRFAFASTLAIYVYDLKTFQLQKLLNGTTSNILAIVWEPTNRKFLAQATYDRKVTIWDVEAEEVKFEVLLTHQVVHMEWNKANQNELWVIEASGDIKCINLASKLVEQISIAVAGVPLICRQSYKNPEILAFGLDNGFICFFNLKSKETYLCDACNSAERISEKQRRYVDQMSIFLTAQNKESAFPAELSPSEVKIVEVQWDPFESNILVSFVDGSISLISYQGFCDKTVISQEFEPQSHSIRCMVWSQDRSGNFYTSSEKIGLLQSWNVASKEPKQSFKVGSSGVH